ncbi:helix-turn-helix transcriptional regulator [Dysgonomonas sp. ZJ279]|uniref:S24 family peptidase n=1 Tax=Dysgonomonas sp. ZJ279 TaxID=2709796 RepID=UPI002104489B|nr:LexA family transcriptional regulator [Dysgonomonas sp. ZJ279]
MIDDLFDRLDKFMSYKGLNDNQMTIQAELSVGSLGKQRKGARGLSSESIAKILHSYKELDANWLLTGDGEMLKEVVHKVPIIQKEEIKEETRPRIPMDAAAGSLTIASDGITINDCEQIPIIRAFARYDFTIFARGDSMLPEYHSGDELACVYIKDTSFVQWGRIHVVDTAQGILVKRIFDGGDCIICKSDNPDYPEFKVSKSEFYNVALVIGMLRRY